MYNYIEQHQLLNEQFKMGNATNTEHSPSGIQFFSFNSKACERDDVLLNDTTEENSSFSYPVFLPNGEGKHHKAILLLHGLNERSWSKYLTWADYLCTQLNRPVILFPLAYHINRSPRDWSNLHNLRGLLSYRKSACHNDRAISIANVALSERMSENPERFYLSGRQSWQDVSELVEDITHGKHPVFAEGAHIDIFAYSIGALLSQIVLMSNQNNLFSTSKLFMFCGGSIFNRMVGVSRKIMDTAAYTKLTHYYVNTFESEQNRWLCDNAYKSFCNMIMPDRHRKERLDFFGNNAGRLSGIALKKDTVIPYDGVKEAIGETTAHDNIALWDFGYDYTHEDPFPINPRYQTEINQSFNAVFEQAVNFLA